MKTQHEVCKPEPHSTKIFRSIISHNGDLRIPRHSFRVLPKDQKQPNWTISLIQHNVNPLVDLFLLEMKANTRSRKPIFICHPVSSLSFMSLKTKLLDRVHFWRQKLWTSLVRLRKQNLSMSDWKIEKRQNVLHFSSLIHPLPRFENYMATSLKLDWWFESQSQNAKRFFGICRA